MAGDAATRSASAPVGPAGAGDPGRSPDFAVHGPLRGQGAVAEGILRALPGWFGIESSIVEYAAAADELPTFVAVPPLAPARTLRGSQLARPKLRPMRPRATSSAS